MTRMQDFGQGITAIDTGLVRPGMAAMYLLVERGRGAFIDTGVTSSLPHALAALRARGLAPEDVAYVMPTHVHLDHAGGAGAMMRAFPNARLVVHPRGARHLIDPQKLIAGVTAVYGPEVTKRQFGDIAPVPAERVIEAPDDFALDFNARPLRFLDTPGHARHHYCVWDAQSRSVFSGDTFGLSYREFDTARGAFILPTTTPVQFEPEALHRSIDRLLALQPRQIFLTHYARVTELERLGRDLHELITAFVEMARAVHGSGPERHAALIQGQRELLLPRLAAHGCTLPAARAEELLAGDYELNAQGLGVWLDREARP
jgi:glyoxylase-like metal-dependent hydrolase (beta-lactamase superfamily II)